MLLGNPLSAALGAAGLLVSVCLAGCIDVNRGATVSINLRQLAESGANDHYEVFATVNGGAVSLERFKVLDSRTACGDALGTPVKLVQRWDEGVDKAALCKSDRRLGAIDLIDLGTATLVGGIRVLTPVDLSDADSAFITIESDVDGDPGPEAAVLRADLGDGVAPHVVPGLACRKTTCDALDPDDPFDAMLFEAQCGDNFPTAPRSRRGVRLGMFLRVPAPTGRCVDLDERQGEIAVVPAEDDTFL